MTADGAISPSARVPAIVSFLNPPEKQQMVKRAGEADAIREAFAGGRLGN